MKIKIGGFCAEMLLEDVCKHWVQVVIHLNLPLSNQRKVALRFLDRSSHLAKARNDFQVRSN